MTTTEEINLTVPQNDKGYNLYFYVKNDDESVFVLTGYEVKLKAWQAGRIGRIKVDGACTISDAPNGECYYTILEGDFDKVGVYSIELQMTKSGVIESTRSYQLQVTESP